MDEVYVVVGPSGAGKDTLIRGACARRPDVHLVRRAITRPADAASEDFESLDTPTFERRKSAGAFALVWQAHGLSYGIPWTEIRRPGPLLMNGSRAALHDTLRVLPGATVVLVTAPEHVLAHRLAARGREDAEDVTTRLLRARDAIPAGLAVRTVLNDATPEIGIARFLAALAPAGEAHPDTVS